MRLGIGLALLLLNLFLAYILYNNIKEPITFQQVKTQKSDVVVSKLQDIRSAQEIYRGITGEFAPNFDTLRYVLQNDSIPHRVPVEIEGKKGEFEEIVTYSSALDSINALGIELDGIQYVPFTDKQTEFAIDADTLTYQQTLVSVVQVGTRWKEFMGEYGSTKYSKYDNSYDPNKLLKFGDMNAPNVSGNWEN